MDYNMDNVQQMIKTIAFFFEKKYNDDISNKIKTFIDDNNLEYTINNNGVFINLNMIDTPILEYIYGIIMSNDNTIQGDMVNSGELFTNIDAPKNKASMYDIHKFIQSPDNIHYTTIDTFLIDLSKVHLTI